MEKKEYCLYSSAVEYEGEYLIRVRNGKGKVYDQMGKLKYKVKYLYGKKIKEKILKNI